MDIKTVGIIAKNQEQPVVETVQTLFGFLQEKRYKALFDESARSIATSVGAEVVKRASLGQRCDLAVVVGGDGTFLSAARSLADYDIPILGINLGRLGFLVDVSPATMLECLSKIFGGDYQEEVRFLLDAEIIRNNKVINKADAFNDVVVHISGVARMIDFETYIDGKFVNRERADGLVVSTPTGSTAYALSSGGPLLHPTLNAIALVPICPHTLSHRPIVVHSSSCVEILISESNQSSVQVSCDGQTSLNVEIGDIIRIQRKKNTIRLIHPANYNYFHILRAKLRWGEQP